MIFSGVKKMNESSPPPNNNSENISDENSRIIDMMLSKPAVETVDVETMIKETQKRVWGALKKGYEYSGVVDSSEKFLREHVFSRMNMVVLYVDLVGSTKMTLELPEEKIAIIISSFAQEMAAIIHQHNGYVLKFVGDAVIGYFTATQNPIKASEDALSAAITMITVIQKGINPILNQYDYPDLMIKIGMDYGENIIVRYGSDEIACHVDILGPAMSIASKIQNMSKSNQILIGIDVFDKLHPASQKNFAPVVWKNNEWNYRSRVTGKIYQVYEYKG